MTYEEQPLLTLECKGMQESPSMATLSKTTAPIALTMGEPAGIGIDLCLEIVSQAELNLPSFFLIGDVEHCRARMKKLGLNFDMVVISSPNEVLDLPASTLAILPIRNGLVNAQTCGIPDPTNNRAVISSIDQAIEFVQSGKASAMVTNPIHKAVLMETGFAYPGHTDYLAHKAGVDHAIMMLASESISPPLRVIPLSVHVALKEVLQDLARQDIDQIVRQTAASLTRDFGIENPRLAFAGWNPHAGEGGSLGMEEIDILKPLIERLRKDHYNISGPFAADSLFHEAARKGYDLVFCGYHDQALIPLKTLDFYGGVNVTLGLPFIRTSPDHGTALDLAGTRRGNTSSLIAAIRLADKMARSRSRSRSR